jgi:3-methylcrotonyl-CoA carboxylase alpha subunit
MGDPVAVAHVAGGVFHVAVGDRRQIVYVAGPSHDRWAFWNGEIFRTVEPNDRPSRGRLGTHEHVRQSLSAPMPATVIRVLVAPGQAVKKGDVLAVLEAMKMELPIRSLSDGIVKAVRCQQGDLVEADQELIELE